SDRRVRAGSSRPGRAVPGLFEDSKPVGHRRSSGIVTGLKLKSTVTNPKSYAGYFKAPNYRRGGGYAARCGCSKKHNQGRSEERVRQAGGKRFRNPRFRGLSPGRQTWEAEIDTLGGAYEPTGNRLFPTNSVWHDSIAGNYQEIPDIWS